MLPLMPLHPPPSSGTKDKRGVTSQMMTAYKVEPARLAALNSRCVWGGS